MLNHFIDDIAIIMLQHYHWY